MLSEETRQTCDTIIRHVMWLDEAMQIHKDSALVIHDGTIKDILPDTEVLEHWKGKTVADGSGKLWMPGLIDSHMHTGQQMLKGRVLDELPMIWTRIMLPFESTLTPNKMRISAELAALEMIRSGTTGFVDAGSYFMETAAEVYLKSGLRGALSHSTMDDATLPESIRQTAKMAIASTNQLFDAFHGQGNLQVFYSIRALLSCSAELITMAAAEARQRNTCLQAHMNEYEGEVSHCIRTHQLRPYEYLDQLGVLSERFIGAHSILLSESELEIMQKWQTKVVHCPFSNCGKGIPDTPRLLERNILVGLGTDGAAHGGLSLWNEMKIFRSVMNASWGVAAANPAIMPAAAILQMATAAGGQILDSSGRLGRISVGCPADLISIDLNSPGFLPSGNLINSLLEITQGADVCDMMINGTWIMRSREVLTLDAERILFEAKEYCTW